FTLVIDATKPVVPTIDAFTDDTGAQGDLLTRAAALSLSG
ncbi:MAG: hypothetical protein RL199_2149, partial [Pseudomonadota bacterium]